MADIPEGYHEAGSGSGVGSAGVGQPRGLAQGGARPAEESGSDTQDLTLARLTRNDLGNAERLIARFGEDLMHVDGAGWHVWDGRRWQFEAGESEALRRAHLTAKAMYAEARALEEEGPFPGEKPKAREERVLKYRKFASGSGNAGKCKAMLEQAVPYLRRPARDLDRLPFTVTVENGTLILDAAPDVAVAGHAREHLSTRLAAVEYDPDATCPHFRQFLKRIQPSEALRNFLQRAMGYCLTGDTGEQVMFVFHGTGANGKSTLVNAVTHVMGDYAVATPIQTFLHDDRKRGDSATPDLARLPGARLVTAAEPEIGARLSESLVKQVTGGDRVTARHLFHDIFEFEPAFKLVLSCNTRPSVRGQDEGIWRRILMVPFDAFIPPHERLPRRVLEARLFAEAPGILNWLLDGYRMWAEQGLGVPDEVRQATDDYRAESDPIGEFLRACTKAGTRVHARALYEAYCGWAKRSAVEPVSQTLFGRRLGDRGIVKEKSGVYSYVGIELLDGLDGLDGSDGSEGGGHADPGDTGQ